MPKVITFSVFLPLLSSSSAVWATASPHQVQTIAASIFFMCPPYSPGFARDHQRPVPHPNPSPGGRGDLNTLQTFKQVRALGYRSLRIDVRISNHTLRIDEKCRARVHAAFVVENAIRFADRAVRPVIREQRKRNAAELLRPGF